MQEHGRVFHGYAQTVATKSSDPENLQGPWTTSCMYVWYFVNLTVIKWSVWSANRFTLLNFRILQRWFCSAAYARDVFWSFLWFCLYFVHRHWWSRSLFAPPARRYNRPAKPAQLQFGRHTSFSQSLSEYATVWLPVEPWQTSHSSASPPSVRSWSRAPPGQCARCVPFGRSPWRWRLATSGECVRMARRTETSHWTPGSTTSQRSPTCVSRPSCRLAAARFSRTDLSIKTSIACKFTFWSFDMLNSLNWCWWSIRSSRHCLRGRDSNCLRHLSDGFETNASLRLL